MRLIKTRFNRMRTNFYLNTAMAWVGQISNFYSHNTPHILFWRQAMGCPFLVFRKKDVRIIMRPPKDTSNSPWTPICDLRTSHYIFVHDDAIKWKHFPRYWPFVRGIHRSTVNSPHKGQWRGALVFSLICTGINGWVNNGEAGDLRRHLTHYDVNVMYSFVLTLK